MDIIGIAQRIGGRGQPVDHPVERVHVCRKYVARSVVREQQTHTVSQGYMVIEVCSRRTFDFLEIFLERVGALHAVTVAGTAHVVHESYECESLAPVVAVGTCESPLGESFELV